MSDSFADVWAIAHQVPLSMGFPRKEYWGGLPFLSPGDLSDPGIEPRSPAFWQILYRPSHHRRFSTLNCNFNSRSVWAQ